MAHCQLIGYIDMETWRIAIPLVMIAIFIIASVYIIKLRLKEIRGKLYVYPKNGHQYMPLFRCRMKCPTSGEWFDAIIYEGVEDEKYYVRERKDFLDKFVKLNDWENEKGSTNRESKES